MLLNEFFDHVKQASPAPVYLFTGNAELLMEEAWKKLLDKIVPEKARRFNGERLTARDCLAAQVLERLSTLPMFGGRQLLMVQHIEEWPRDERQILETYIRRPHPTACLVLTALQRKGLDKLEAAVKSAGIVVQFSGPTEKDAPRWLQERARTLGKQLTPQAAFFLFEQVGLDLHCLEMELEKLSIYVGDRTRIDVEDVGEVVSAQRSYSVFELLRHVGLHQTNQAVHSLRNLVLSGEAPLAILALLARQIRLVWQVKDGLQRGLALAQIAQGTGLSPFVVKNYVQQASQFSESVLLHAHQALRNADIAIKSSGSAPEMILECLVLDLCQRN
ncbi:DNA polymerase III subunit delta [Desulforhabdus amnigena]|uniref:DNA polymerase III subunit delta n=1 Tax=Desulforhabdus amnigena TaxID=40218 RepID=A0A9W6FWL9_9BACT|nr:DNA polymerase III subunit delta [Desulforhabdus amnigena]GLI36236.1 DNA polymerase III subunit delta [Desulforhabdus amnigena]